jgi:hypothetical protein
MRDVQVIVSLDAEEDNWLPSHAAATVENIAAVRPLAKFFERLGVRPTYFTTYQVALDRRAADTLREACADGRGEIGAHLHPWNTPPLARPLGPRTSMLNNLPADLQRAKLVRLTAALAEAFGEAPRTFRAGRYGFGRETVAPLLDCGYQVDSSVSPFTNLEAEDGGPNFVGAPITPYLLAPGRDVREAAPDGTLLEIPLSYGFSRGPFRFWDRACRMLEARPQRWLHLPGIASRLGIVRRLSLSPEYVPTADMLTLSRRLLEHEVPYLHVSFHTPTLVPGLSPFARTAADVAGLYASIEEYFHGLSRMARVAFMTIGEVAAALREGNRAGAEALTS